MDIQKIAMNKHEARELLLQYRAHRSAHLPQDVEIERAYQNIARGRIVVQALASIVKAGFNEQGLPKLAIARADQNHVEWHPIWNGSGGAFKPSQYQRGNAAKSLSIEVMAGSFPGQQNRPTGRAIVPMIPVWHRPKTALDSYHILWEAEWRKAYPVDPYLLRRIGGDLWLVVAAWDLTEVERAVMASRPNS